MPGLMQHHLQGLPEFAFVYENGSGEEAVEKLERAGLPMHPA